MGSLAEALKAAEQKYGKDARRIKRGDIWYVPERLLKFPEDDLPASDSRKTERKPRKSRPVLIVSADNLSADSIIIVPITTRGTKTLLNCELAPEYLSKHHDPCTCYARMHLTQPLHKHFLEDRIGRIPRSDPKYGEMDSYLMAVMGLLE